MTRDELLTRIKREKPGLIYLSGKTTLSGILQTDHDYTAVSFDDLIRYEIAPTTRMAIGDVFVEIYANGERRDLIEQFIEAAYDKIDAALASGKPVVVDGTISNIATLRAVLTPYPERTLVYLHPESLEAYIDHITSRFKRATKTHDAGLPNRFWDGLNDDDFAAFCETGVLNNGVKQTIRRYATGSQTSSVERLAVMQNAFGDILVVNV